MPKDGIPALTDPEFIDADEADYLDKNDLIVGITIDGQAKAYPIKILNWHEIINDSINYTSYAVTWCPLTSSALTFDRRYGAQTLEFGVSGLLYNSNVVMYDRSNNGLWSQMKMAGLTGGTSGQKLNLLATEVSSWGRWKDLHPRTRVLSIRTGHTRSYNQDPYAGYHKRSDAIFPLTNTDKRLPLKSIVIGVNISGQAKAYLLKDLREPLVDVINGEEIKIQPYANGAIVEDGNGLSVPSVIAYWFAWSGYFGKKGVLGRANN